MSYNVYCVEEVEGENGNPGYRVTWGWGSCRAYIPKAMERMIPEDSGISAVEMLRDYLKNRHTR